VASLEMVTEAGREIGRKADIVELAPAVEGANAVTVPDVLADKVLVFFQCLPGNVFQVLTD
jgi:hypothetical protein